MTADMSASLNVVRSAALCWAETRRSAIFRRSGESFLLVWRSAGLAGGTAGASCGGAAGRAASAARSMSPFVTRPALPVPATAAGSTPVSPAILRTAGDWTGAASAAFATGAGSGAGAAFGAGAAAGWLWAAWAGAPPASIRATTWPIFTSAPCATLREMAPAASAYPSEVILSVSSSKRGWSLLTVSPSFTCHLARTPELIDSPMGGIFDFEGHG